MSELNSNNSPTRSAYSPRLHYAGAVLWASFLAACIGTMVFFAMFDPADLGQITTWPIALDREWGYTLGFFGFWLLSLLASLITLVLLLPWRKSKNSNNVQ